MIAILVRETERKRKDEVIKAWGTYRKPSDIPIYTLWESQKDNKKKVGRELIKKYKENILPDSRSPKVPK
jgi:hypothetical protein